MFSALLVIGSLCVFLNDYIESWLSLLQPRWSWLLVLIPASWFVLPRIPRLVMKPYVRLLKRRCADDPLMAGNYFWMTLRRSTLTARTDDNVETWPLRNVHVVHSGDDLLVLRVARHRLLYVMSTAATMPENFQVFRRGVRRRLRRYWREQFFFLEIN